MIDLTDNYKYREGTAQERNSFKRAKGMVNLRYSRELELFNEISTNSIDDVTTKINLQDIYRLGKAIEFSVKLINNVNATRTIYLKITVDSMYYNGKIVANIEDQIEIITLNIGEGKYQILNFKKQ